MVVTPIPGAAGSTAELLVVSRDVTELMRAKDALAQANERKDEFLTALSHELRNPLAALGMAAKVLETLEGGSARVSGISELIQRQVRHMSRLAEDLLDVSRITRGQVNLHMEEFDLRDSIDDVAEQLTSMLTSKNQTLQQSLAETPVRIKGDRMRLAQVLGNLVGNASRYSPQGSSIRVSIGANDGFATVTVSDQGQGIPASALSTLFDMYSQGQVTGDGRASGVGMGLSIVKGLIELHGGTVRAESEGADMGSTFIVSLPLCDIQSSG